MRAATTTDDSRPTPADAMENEKNPDHSNMHYIERAKQPKRLVSRTRLVMGLLLIVAVPIFISLANKVVQENAGAIRQVLGR
jgi:ABC-type Fe2+-enterobactin transport system substrate-binding protein